MMLQFDFTRFYDVIIRNSVFQLGFLTRKFQIPRKISQENVIHIYDVKMNDVPGVQ